MQEQNTIMTAGQQAAAFRALSALLDEVYGAGADRPYLVGPDPHSFRDAGSAIGKTLVYLSDFVKAMGDVPLRAVTHHEYIEIDYLNVLNASFLDTSAELGDAIVKAVRGASASVEVWAGEVRGGPRAPRAAPRLPS